MTVRLLRVLRNCHICSSIRCSIDDWAVSTCSKSRRLSVVTCIDKSSIVTPLVVDRTLAACRGEVISVEGLVV